LHQHIFELNFQVDELRASLSKSTAEGTENLLGEVSLGQFGLDFTLAKYDMHVDINLR
jgi:vacuolar protein sorting-associated protein 13A/C